MIKKRYSEMLATLGETIPPIGVCLLLEILVLVYPGNDCLVFIDIQNNPIETEAVVVQSESVGTGGKTIGGRVVYYSAEYEIDGIRFFYNGSARDRIPYSDQTAVTPKTVKLIYSGNHSKNAMEVLEYEKGYSRYVFFFAMQIFVIILFLVVVLFRKRLLARLTEKQKDTRSTTFS